MVSATLLFSIGFSIPVLIALGICALMYWWVTKDVKKPKTPSSAGYEISAEKSVLSALQNEAEIQKAVQIEQYADRIETWSKGRPDELKWITYANQLRAYAKKLRRE